MSAPPYQKFFWGSYHKHTSQLRDARDHGAYLLLIGALWNNGGRLPADDDVLAGYAKLSAKEWAGIKPRLMPLFRIVRGSLTQLRVTEDLAKYESTSGKRKAAGKAGGEARARNHTENRQAIATSLPTKPEPESEPKKEVLEGAQVLPFGPKPAGDVTVAPKRGVRLAGGWVPSQADLEFAFGEGFSNPEVSRIADTFRDYWLGQPGQKGVKLDWHATWKNWVRRERDRRRPASGQAAKRVDWV